MKGQDRGKTHDLTPGPVHDPGTCVLYSATINLVLIEMRQNETITTKGHDRGKTHDLTPGPLL